jgi:hypothetical protein
MNLAFDCVESTMLSDGSVRVRLMPSKVGNTDWAADPANGQVIMVITDPKAAASITAGGQYTLTLTEAVPSATFDPIVAIAAKLALPPVMSPPVQTPPA